MQNLKISEQAIEKIKDSKNDKLNKRIEDVFNDPSNPQDTFSQIDFEQQNEKQWVPPLENLDFGEDVQLLDVNTDPRQKESSENQNNYVSIQTVKNNSTQKYSSANTTNQNYEKYHRNNKNADNIKPYSVKSKQNNDENAFSQKSEDDLSQNGTSQKELVDENQQNKTNINRINDLKELRKVMASKEEKANARP